MFSALQKFGRLGASASRSWSESALWPLGASSPGLWIDQSYVASCYQDSAGTTALSTVGTVLDSSNPVGLVLDRKNGLELGPELVQNGFDWLNPTNGFAQGWRNDGNSGPTASVVDGTLNGFSGNVQRYENGAGGTYRSLITTAVTIGRTGETTSYLVSFKYRSNYSISNAHGGAFSLSAPVNTGVASPYRKIWTFTGTDSTDRLRFLVGSYQSDGWLEIDDVSIREIPGIHLSQSTSAARPVASARKNLLVGTATLSTQSVTVTAIPHTITFSGGGTVTASGTYTGALTSGQTFTPTAGTLTLTVSGTVTSAQLERGSAATTYQAVVSASDYTATGFPVYTKFDGTDDALSSATFSAGTLTSSMDCLIAIRRDSTANAVCGLYESVADANKVFGIAESGSGSGCVGAGAGTPTVWVDGTQLTGGTAVTRDTLHTALTAGAWHILELRGLDLSTWTAAGFGKYTSYILNGALGKIELFASGQDSNRDEARAKMAQYSGVTLP